MNWISSITSSRCSPFPTEVDRRSSVQWYEIENGQAIAVFDRPCVDRGTGQRRQRQMVYRIAGDGAIQDQFEVDLQTGSIALTQADASLPARSRAPGTGDPVRRRASYS